MSGGVRQRPRLLYISAADINAGDDILPLESRISIGVLSRDFDVSLAVAGPVGTVALNRLRLSLGPMRVTGAFESSRADRPADKGLRRAMKEAFDTDVVSARLQATIQRVASEVDFVVVDSLLAWPYRPVGVKGPTAFVARETQAMMSGSRRGFLSNLRGRGMADYEKAALSSADMVFAAPELAASLSEWGIPMRSLQVSFNKPDSASPTLAEVDYSLTARRIGYMGYLADPRNIASLNWFLDNVWSVAAPALPDVEFHIVGKAPSRELREKMVRYPNIKLHWSSDDQQLLAQRCRVVVEPLLFEDHVDAKLINAMARGIPTVTTRHAMKRCHCSMQEGIIATDSREGMALAINRLLSDPAVWKNAARTSAALAREQLPAFELAHCMRRELARWRAASAIA